MKPAEQVGGTRGFLPAVEGMRACAAMGVVLTHVAFQTGTTQEEEITAAQEACGSDPINTLSYQGQDEVNNALMIGKADAMLADYPITQNAIQTSNGKMEALVSLAVGAMILVSTGFLIRDVVLSIINASAAPPSCSNSPATTRTAP